MAVTNKNVTFEIRGANSIIGVKEHFQVYFERATNSVIVNVTLGIDNAFTPCKACIFMGTEIVPLGTLNLQAIQMILRGRKGIYSRLDCTGLVCTISGKAIIQPDGSLYWAKNPCKLYVPVSISADKLITTPAENSINPTAYLQISNNILSVLGSTLTSKEKFLKRRV